MGRKGVEEEEAPPPIGEGEEGRDRPACIKASTMSAADVSSRKAAGTNRKKDPPCKEKVCRVCQSPTCQ